MNTAPQAVIYQFFKIFFRWFKFVFKSIRWIPLVSAIGAVLILAIVSGILYKVISLWVDINDWSYLHLQFVVCSWDFSKEIARKWTRSRTEVPKPKSQKIKDRRLRMLKNNKFLIKYVYLCIYCSWYNYLFQL